jgi:hypothetical protein
MLILKHFYLDIGIRFPKSPSKEQFLFVLLVPPPKHPTVPPTNIFTWNSKVLGISTKQDVNFDK